MCGIAGASRLNRQPIVADEVIVGLGLVPWLKNSTAMQEMAFPRKATFRKQLKRTVNRGITYLGVTLLHTGSQFIYRDMLGRLKKYLENKLTLAGLLETLTLQVGP